MNNTLEEYINYPLTNKKKPFLQYLKIRYGVGYPELAGFKEEFMIDEDELDEGSFTPTESDCSVFNDREQGGYWCMCHESSEIHYIFFYENSYYDELAEALAPKQVDGVDLWERYSCLSKLFSTFSREIEVDFGFESWKDLNSNFKKDKPSLSEDPHLCVYWLLVFGFLDDENAFNDVLEHVNSRNPLIKACLAFFESFSSEEIDLSHESDEEEDKAFFRVLFKNRYDYLLSFYRE